MSVRSEGPSSALVLDESNASAEVVRAVARRTFTQLRRESSNGSNGMVKRTVQYLLENYADDVQLDDVAHAAGLSKFHFGRQFRKETGITPGAFLQRLRVVQAMHLLTNSDQRIHKIASKVGYRNAAAFSRAFLKTTGTQPNLYRGTH